MTLTHIFAPIDDRLNPVMIKTLRQLIRSRFIIGLLILLLLVFLVGVALSAAAGELNQSASHYTGIDLYKILLSFFVFITVLIIPAYLALRMNLERYQKGADLMYTTILTPGAIVRGYSMVGFFLVIIVISSLLPLLMLVHRLKGFESSSVWIGVTLIVCSHIVAQQLFIFVACISVSRLFKVIAGIGIVLMMTLFCAIIIRIAFLFLESGAETALGGADFGLWIIYLLLPTAALAGAFHIQAVSALKPAAANRAWMVRIYFTIAWLIYGLAVLGKPYYSTEGFPVAPKIWIVCTMAVLWMVLLASVSQKDGKSLRIRSAIPQSKLKKAGVFIFSDGAANGIAFALVLMLFTFALAGFSGVNEVFLLKSVAVFLYFYDYALTGLLLRRKCFTKMRPQNTIMVVITIIILFNLAPVLTIVLLDVKSDFDVALFGNFLQFTFSRDGHVYQHLIMALIWACVISAFNFSWFIGKWRAFAPPRFGTRESH